MSLTRRNIIAWVLLLVAAFAWVFGQNIIARNSEDIQAVTTLPTGSTFAAQYFGTYPPEYDSLEAYLQAEGSLYPTTGEQEASSVPQGYGSNVQYRQKVRLLGYLLCAAAIACAVVSTLVLRMKAPVLGPDGLCVLAAVLYWVYAVNAVGGAFSGIFALPAVMAVMLFAALVCLRELWGWLLGKEKLSWCLSYRLAQRCHAPYVSMAVFFGWSVFCVAGIALVAGGPAAWSVVLLAASGTLSFSGLMLYGKNIRHLQQQLEHFKAGQPITVGEGPFADTEAQLIRIQSQHREAVQSAVTSERFKVELIANVSHDLRTPLTSILGYGELLQKETLSPEGKTQLDRLCTKAGYMNDLVDALFELTKVSSGAAEVKMEQIDLIKLLEQTVGLLDDRLTQAKLTVRRNYSADAVAVMTDGGRMHQVFFNLLGNAVKYALPGTRIFLEVTQQESTCTVRMVNTASYEMDFSPEEIVQRFARGDKARTGNGSGLGLAIAQTYTESVGGAFRVQIDGDQFNAIVKLPKT